MQRVDALTDGAPAADTISTGFPSVDRLLGGGLRRGDLIMLAGDVGSGKSALALAMALRGARAGRSVVFFTGEMAVERVVERALGLEARIPVDDLRRGAVADATRVALGAAALRMRHSLPTVERIPCDGPAALGDALRRSLDAELAIVDGLPALATGRHARDEELAAAACLLKAQALEANLALLVTASLHVPVAERANPRPVLDDLGMLGAAKQVADVVLALFREEMYGDGTPAEGAAELTVLKNRNGSGGYADLYFHKQWLRFEDVMEPE